MYYGVMCNCSMPMPKSMKGECFMWVQISLPNQSIDLLIFSVFCTIGVVSINLYCALQKQPTTW